jgi:hypothetical protein
MHSTLHKELLAQIVKLKKVTQELSLESLVNFVWMQQHKFNHNQAENVHLSSPLRQGMYLLGIACNQIEPSEQKSLDDGKCTQLINLLNEIFNKYALAYFPQKNELLGGLDKNWHKHREIAMPAFIHYFTTGFNISSDQIKSWIRFYFDGFEHRIESKFGVSHIDLLEAGAFFEEYVAKSLGSIKDSVQSIEKGRQEFLAALESGQKYEEVIQSLQNNSNLKQSIKSFYHGSNQACSIEIKEIRDHLGDKLTNSLLEHFTTIRGDAEEFTYITDENSIVDKPLLSLSGTHIYFLVNNSYYQAIINVIESELSKGKGSQKFFKSRDKRLEEKTTEQFCRLFSRDALVIESAFETNDSHHEHDLVISHGKYLYIIEAKASPPREPLREPSKAYQRIKDHFRSKSGIQKAYEQANKLRKSIIENDAINLYDQKGSILININKSDYDEIFCICITRDDFGALATNLNLLLEKEQDEAYPWVISIADLEFLINGWKHLKLDSEYFTKFLIQRSLVHGKVFGMDELEYAGAFINYNGFDDFINAEADLIPLDISESNVFDEIYFAEKNGEVYDHSPTEPDFVKLDRNSMFKKTGGPKVKNKSKLKRKAQKKSKKANRKRKN